MTVFDMKQWLQENEVGPYAKAKMKEDMPGVDLPADDTGEEMPVDEDIEEETTQEQMGIGYVMKVRPSDPR